MTDQTATRQALVIERRFAAPRELVYRAFTDADQLAAWFAPDGFSTPRGSIEIDPRPGGHHRYVMAMDADPDWASAVDVSFNEVIENELLAGSYTWEGVPGIQEGGEMQLRVEFHDDAPGTTRLVLTQGPYAEGMEDLARRGWLSSFTKLDALLAA